MVWTIEQLSAESELSLPIVKAIVSLNKALIEESSAITTEEKKAIVDLLILSLNNSLFNRTIKTLSTQSKRDTGIDNSTFQILLELSHRSTFSPSLQSRIAPIYEGLQQHQQNNPLSSIQKMTLKEYGLIHHIAAMAPSLARLNEKGLLSDNAKLKAEFKLSQQCLNLKNYYDSTFKQQFRFPSGALVFDNTVHKSKVLVKKLPPKEKAISKIFSSYGHTSRGISVTDEQGTSAKISHINPGYKEESFTLRNALYADIYRLQLIKLINKKYYPILEETYGKNWQQVIEQKFSLIERQLHDAAFDKHAFISAETGTERMLKIGASHLFFKSYQSPVQQYKTKDVHDEIFRQGKWEAQDQTNSRLLCSEFVGKTLIASIEALNKEIITDLQQKDPDILRPIIKPPISQNERLSLLTPDRLLSLLKKKRLLEYVPLPLAVSEAIQKDNIKQKVNVPLLTLDEQETSKSKLTHPNK